MTIVRPDTAARWHQAFLASRPRFASERWIRGSVHVIPLALAERTCRALDRVATRSTPIIRSCSKQNTFDEFLDGALG